MGNWALLTYKLDAPDPERTEFEASIELTGWQRVDGVESSWYGRTGRMNWRQVLVLVENMLEIAALQSDITSDIPFVIHTGDSPPHVGVARALDPVKKRTEGFRTRHRTKPVPAATKKIKPLTPTKKLTKNQGS